MPTGADDFHIVWSKPAAVQRGWQAVLIRSVESYLVRLVVCLSGAEGARKCQVGSWRLQRRR